VSRADVDAVRRRLGHGERIVEFEMDPVPLSSSEIRARAAAGESLAGLVPPVVAEAIARLGLYGRPE
jgi:nicotinic acid mononucleotide adenylyltransferase